MHALNSDNIIDNSLSFDKQFYHKHGFVKIQHLLTVACELSKKFN